MASGRTLSPASAALQQVSAVPAIPAQPEPTTPGQFFQAEAFDSISCNSHHPDDNRADAFDDSAYIKFSRKKFREPSPDHQATGMKPVQDLPWQRPAGVRQPPGEARLTSDPASAYATSSGAEVRPKQGQRLLCK